MADQPARDAESVVAQLGAALSWHKFRGWQGDYKEPPANTVNPCGDCGRAEADHPIPRLNLHWAESEAVGRMIAAAAQIDGADDGR